MNVNHYIGFDVHKKSISYCVKLADGTIVEEGKLAAKRATLCEWASKRTEAWHGAMEATLFSAWIYDTLKPFAAKLEMGHPAMMKAIGASEKEERQVGRPQGCRPAARQPVAGVLGGAERDPRVAAAATLPSSGGGPGGANEEQDQRSAHGERRGVQQETLARGEVFRGTAGESRRGAGIGDRSAAI